MDSSVVVCNAVILSKHWSYLCRRVKICNFWSAKHLESYMKSTFKHVTTVRLQNFASKTNECYHRDDVFMDYVLLYLTLEKCKCTYITCIFENSVCKQLHSATKIFMQRTSFIIFIHFPIEVLNIYLGLFRKTNSCQILFSGGLPLSLWKVSGRHHSTHFWPTITARI